MRPVNCVYGFKFDGLPGKSQDRVYCCGGIGVSDYYIGIYGEGKLEGNGRWSLKIQYETLGKSVNIVNLGMQND